MVGAEKGKQLEAFERLDAGNALHAYLTACIGAGEHTKINHRRSAAGAYVSGEREANRVLAYLDKFHPRHANRL
ncbi:hypothetical protein [Sporisorium scitamineum]|uniref:Uncharacterized protein n=1 Tax=Sporisorium scitamineum TaxID=49012 RepID=A0A0F7S1E8_9BASI|nr:hypothetical protein [Sporisorium scitamineum]